MIIRARRISDRHSRFGTCRWHIGCSSVLLLLTMTASIPVQADGEVISELITRSVDATSSTIQVDGQSYRWGQETNLELDGFFIGNDEYVKNLKASSVSVRRRAIPNPDNPNPDNPDPDNPDKEPDELCGVFAERHGSVGNELKPDFTALTDQAGICDMSAMLMSSIINRGTLDTFTNTGTDPNNIERIDYYFKGGIVAPFDPSKLTSAGHAIGEKKGNNRVQMATILLTDESGRPTKYGPLVSIGGVGMCSEGGICYGSTSIVHDNVFFKSHSFEPLLDLQEITRFREPVAFAFLSMETLGVHAGEVYYGISVFPHDVSADEHDLLDISSFPTNTEETTGRTTDSADIYGGSASLYIIPSGVTGRVFCQADDNETAPKANVPISLFRDTVADGGVLDDVQDELIAELPGTSMLGRYSFLGLDNGSYFVVTADRADDDAATLAIVINSSPVEDADIVLDEPCIPIILLGPTAVDDLEKLDERTTELLNVLVNDFNANGEIAASELEITNVSGSTAAELEIQQDGRAVVYTLTQETRDRLVTVPLITDTFSYTIEDDQGLTSQANVTVEITVKPREDDPCPVPLGNKCPIETEVEGIGVGRIPPLACFLLLTFVVIRRYALLVKGKGELS